MIKWIYFLLVVLASEPSFGQAYQPMPVDSATWRYRTLEVDNLVTVTDFILFQDGSDTVASGNTYKKIFIRSFAQTGLAGFNPPIVPVVAGAPDLYFGGVRESGRKVYYLSGTHEQMIFDFTASVGSTIPSSLSTVQVTAIDSILVGGAYHKRFKTTDTTYFAVEGVGSNRGLIPDIVDGSGTVTFHCFSHGPDTWTPIDSIGCTAVYPVGYNNSVVEKTPASDWLVVPNPASLYVRIFNASGEVRTCSVSNMMGQVVWTGTVDKVADVYTGDWPRGIYFLRSQFPMGITPARMVVE